MFIFIFLDALFRKGDVAAHKLAEPSNNPAKRFAMVRSASRSISGGRRR